MHVFYPMLLVRNAFAMVQMIPTRINPFECFAESKITNDIEAHEREIQDDINTPSALFAHLADKVIDAL